MRFQWQKNRGMTKVYALLRSYLMFFWRNNLKIWYKPTTLLSQWLGVCHFYGMALLKRLRELFLHLCSSCQDSVQYYPVPIFLDSWCHQLEKSPAQIFTVKAAGKLFPLPSLSVKRYSWVIKICNSKFCMTVLRKAIYLLSYPTLGLSKPVAWSSSLRCMKLERNEFDKEETFSYKKLGIFGGMRRNHTSELWKQNQ